MWDNGRITKGGERVNSSGQMVPYMKDSGVITQRMEKED